MGGEKERHLEISNSTHRNICDCPTQIQCG